MSNIDKQAHQVSRYDLVSGYMHKWPDGEFVYHSDYQALLDELEAKDAQIANLTAERNALREGVMGDAKHSNTRAAADIYFQLVEECEIPAGGSLVEYVSELRERAAMLQGADGNSPTIPDELIRRIAFNLVYLAADEKLRSDEDSLFTLVRSGMGEVRKILVETTRK